MWQALELAVAPPPSPPSRRRGERSRGGGEAFEGGEGEAARAAMQEADAEGGASTGTLSTLRGEARLILTLTLTQTLTLTLTLTRYLVYVDGGGGGDRRGRCQAAWTRGAACAGELPPARDRLYLPCISPISPLPLPYISQASFHQLVTAFRAEVEQATVAEATVAEAAEAAAAAAAAGKAGTAGVEAAGGAGRAAAAAARAAAPERLDLPGSGTRQRAEGGDVAAAVRRRANGEARQRGSARSDDGWTEEPGGLAGLFRALVRQSGYEAMVRGEDGEPGPRPGP